LISALSIAFLWISWVCRGLSSKGGPDADWSEQDVSDVLDKQTSLLRVASDLAFNDALDVDARVRRKAFLILGDMYWLFGGDMFHVTKGVNRHRLHMTCPETTQIECEHFVRSEIELLADKVQEKLTALQEARRSKASQDKPDGSDDDEDTNDDNEDDSAVVLEEEKQAAAQVELEEKHEMFGTVFSFMRQIILKDCSMEHAPALLAQFGRFGIEFDEGIKRVVTAIKAQTADGHSRQMRAHKAETFMDVCLESLKKVLFA
jgi:cohesin complex subunit SA-1/2